MKKAIATALCMLLVPAVAMAMQPVSEAELDTVTGQSGVSIVIDDVQIYQHMDGQETWYQDTSDNASVGFVYDDDESYTMMYVNAIGPGGTDDSEPDGDSFGDTGTQGTYKSDYSDSFAGDGDDVFSASQLTIDVEEALSASGKIEDNGDVAGVRIGLPTVEIYHAEGSSDIMNIAVSTADKPLDDGDPESFGKIHQTPGDSTMAILDGYVEISPNDAWD